MEVQSCKQTGLKGYQVCIEKSVTRAEVECPRCGSDAIYRYGRTHSGKPRFICILCRRQFSAGIKKCEFQNKPSCPLCGRSMHIYKREKGSIRFRCSAYPQCKTYKKIVVGEDRDEPLPTSRPSQLRVKSSLDTTTGSIAVLYD